MKKIISIAALAALLGGCMPSQDHLTANVVSPEPDWIKYLENDGSVGNIAFFSENLSKTYALKDGDVIGMAIVKRADMALKLGDMYALNGLSFTVLELDDKEKFGYRYVNMRDKNELATLRNAKKVKFYQFGGGILESVVFSADSGAVCESFAAGKAVKAHAVTNYYDKESPNNSAFFATLMDIGVKKGKSAEIKNLDFKFFVSDGKLASTQTRARSAEFRSKVIDADAKKQERILSNIVCAAPKN
ncbi:hypothetical protein [Campylobacter concisus]|uniref:hypothetical protein n=1 Tax=Campylobacter concisus TaxID=199 RepID=UPI00130E8153|nr:hypothetical protein [Campylobacter concisus]